MGDATRIDAATRRQAGLIVALGVALRVLWMLLAHASTDRLNLGEASNAALAFARTGTIADAFFAGQGATAHLLPTTIVIAGLILRLFGPESAAAQLALATWSLLQVLAGFALAAALFRRLGAPRAAWLGGLALLCLLPTHVAEEAADFRVWEGALAFDLAAANLLWLTTLAARERWSTRDLVVGAALAAACFFVSPPAGLAVDACWATFALRRLPLRRTAGFAALAAAALALLVVPWALRNHALLGESIWLRSNFGLELAVANHAAAVAPVDPRATLAARMEAVHPSASPAAAAALRAAGGEIAYARRLGAETQHWIAAHPLAFARLALRHYRQFYVPDAWQRALTNWGGFERPRIVLLQAVGALGLLGLALGLWRRRRGYGTLALYIAVAGLPYALVQPIPRYSYLVYPLLAMLATGLPADLARRRRA